MNTDSYGPAKTQLAVYLVAILGSFLIMAILVGYMRSYIQTVPVDAARAEERRKALNEINLAAKEQLENYGYVDPAKNQVRLPIQRAMEIVVQDWKNPVAARSNLLARVNQFNPPPPPKAPEKPSPFE
ncbi:MAG: hypothetical protein FJ403_18330 [Verrucomicrobia bacterium]|nr:hypothetical protein [Verrucomicrobiota bacterium]